MPGRSYIAALVLAAFLPQPGRCEPDATSGKANQTAVSPEQFGAKGDGVTDDSAAIQAAIDSLPDTGGKVLFAARTYGIGTTLVITRSWVTLEGVNAGIASMVFDHTPASGSVLKALEAVDLLSMHPLGKGLHDRLKGIMLRKLGFYGRAKTDGHTAIKLDGADGGLTLDTLRVLDCAVSHIGQAMSLKGPDACVIADTWVCENGAGILIDGSVYPTVTNCGISDHPGTGLAIVHTSGGVVTGNVFVRDKKAIELSAARGLTIGNNVYVADSPGDKSYTRDYALFIGEGSNNNTVTGENISGDKPSAWTGAGICITGNAAGNVVTGVRVADCAVGIQIDSTTGNNVVTGGYIDAACPTSLAVTAGTGNVIRISYNLTTAKINSSAVTPLDLSGSSSPEGAVTAPIGSRYQRADGGAGTSFYVKESGTGSTGWVGK